MKVLVTGSRAAVDREHVFAVMDAIHAKHKVKLVLEGGASGVDLMARKWARYRGLRYITCRAEWTKYGDAAGPIRNSLMLKEHQPDLVVAFAGNRGTADMVRKARAANIPVENPDGCW